MEFEGRITKVLPVRSGTSQNGNTWNILPFVFSYYENADQRWEDSVILETFDTNQMAQIAKYLQKGADGKAIKENGQMKLAVKDIKCKCGFSHRVRSGQRQDGTPFNVNDIRMYRFEIPVANAAGVGSQQPANPFAPQQQAQVTFPPAGQEANDDDLPF